MMRLLGYAAALAVAPTAAAVGFGLGFVVEGAKAAAAIRAGYAQKMSFQSRYEAARRRRIIAEQMAALDRQLGLTVGSRDDPCEVRPEGHLWGLSGEGALCLACGWSVDEEEVRTWTA